MVRTIITVLAALLLNFSFAEI